MASTLTPSDTHAVQLDAGCDSRDIQDESPIHSIPLAHVGITGAQRMLTISIEPQVSQSMLATIRAGASLDAKQRGAHMSRFHEAADEAAHAAEARHPLVIAAHIAAEIASRQQVQASSATLRGNLVLADTSPITQRPCQLPVAVHAGAACAGEQWRGIVQVSVAGMNACPCAQQLVRDSSAKRLVAAGFSPEESERILDLLPGATHNQRGTATLTLGFEWTGDWNTAPAPCWLAVQVALARSSMGTTIHELLKRSDEHAVVVASHARPRFVEDCTRELLAQCAANPHLDDATCVWAHQINHESIHAHDVETLSHARLGDLRAGTTTSLSLDPSSWLLDISGNAHVTPS